MTTLRKNNNRSLSNKRKRLIVFQGWRRHIGRNKKIYAKEPKNFDLEVVG